MNGTIILDSVQKKNGTTILDSVEKKMKFVDRLTKPIQRNQVHHTLREMGFIHTNKVDNNRNPT